MCRGVANDDGVGVWSSERRSEVVHMDVASFVSAVFKNELPFRVEAYDGSVALPTVASAGNDLTLKILRREALTRVLPHPGELGVARAYVAGDLDIDGELDALFDLSVPPLRSLMKIENLRALLSVEIGR